MIAINLSKLAMEVTSNGINPIKTFSLEKDWTGPEFSEGTVI